MAKRGVAVTYAFGLRDRVDPKLAPFGVLEVGKNLRVRKDGRLGVRKGYQPLSTATHAARTLVAYDLHEYRGRLCALGCDMGDGYPTDLYEYLGLAVEPWRATDRVNSRVMLNPFTQLTEAAGIPQCEGGVSVLDAAAGGGYVCLAYASDGVGGVAGFMLIVRQSDDQVIYQAGLNSATRLRVAYAGGTFYVGRAGDGSVQIDKFTPGVDVAAVGFATVAAAGNPITAFDLVPVTHGSTGRVAVAFDRGATDDLSIKVYQSNGAQLGATISVAGTNTIHLSLECDQVNDSINLYTVEGTVTGQLRTFTFAGALTAGPTTMTVGPMGSICRVPALGAQVESVAVAVNDANRDITITYYAIAGHVPGVLTSTVVRQAALASRLVSAQSANNPRSVAFSALVAPNIKASFEDATNALFFVKPFQSGFGGAIHMTTRDLAKGMPTNLVNLTRDATTGKLCWVALRDPGVASLGMPAVTMVDFMSPARRQSARFGGLLYFAGGTPAVYDGRLPTELYFNELPGVVSLTPSNGAGSLTPGANYTYVHHWEFVLADGSLMQSEPSTPVKVTMGPGQDTVTAIVNGPHSIRIAAGSALYGADVVSVLSRTTWDPTNSSAALLGDRDFSDTPAVAGDFTGLTLDWSVDGGATQTVTFGAADNLLSEIVSAINGQTTGLTAVDLQNQLYVTSDGQGAASSLTIVGGTATASGVGFVGLTTGSTATGRTGGISGSVYRRSQTKPVFGAYGGDLTITDTRSDVDLGDEEVLYTQGTRGSLSGPLPHDAPQACKYITATESRLITGGLLSPSKVQCSKEAYLGEAIAFSEFSTFFSQVSSPVEGVHRLDGAKLIFTSDTVFNIPGEGPDDQGGGGLGGPVEIPTPSGLEDARSILEAPDGLWFQLDDDKLFRMPRGGGVPEWEGVDIQDTLALYPVITGACKSKRDNAALFACVANSFTDARLLVRDFRTQNWFEDTPVLGLNQGIEAVCSWLDSFAYISGGVVYVQSSTSHADGVSSFIDTEVRTQPLYPFGVGGYGLIAECLLTGEYRGACLLSARVSYDDGLTFTTLDTFTLTGLPLGQTIQRKWSLPQDITSSVVFEVSTSDSSGPSEGFVFNQLDLLVETEDGLRELDPLEMA